MQHTTMVFEESRFAPSRFGCMPFFLNNSMCFQKRLTLLMYEILWEAQGDES